MDDLAELRQKGMLLLAWIVAALLAVTAIGAFRADSGVTPVILALITSAGPATLAMRGNIDASARTAMALSITAFPMIWLYQWSGSEMMIDLHMVFFAALAILAVLADWRPIIAGAAAVAVHHLSTNFLAPWLVYPDGPDVMRVVLHAVVLIAEAGALVALCHQLELLIVRQAEAREVQASLERTAAEERAVVAAEQKQVIDSIGIELDALARGNLTARIHAPFPPAYEPLRTSFNAAVEDLDAIVSQILASVAQINTGSNEIRTAADDLARRTEEQASALERNSASTHNLTRQIEATAKSAGDVSTSVKTAQHDAQTGGEVVEDAVTAMTAIERSSNEIAQIITIIDGIAFQTNLLALNAGVEAARAGDAGRGFAVVANEVRALAQRSADAAHDIKTLINTSSAQVGQGVDLVRKTGEVLGTIVEHVRSVGQAIRTIASESASQATELHTVSQTFAQIDNVTQQNAAMVEESTAAAHGLQRQADAMKQLVERFKTSNPREGNAGTGRSATKFSAAA
ncbi:methyl-accepting chemotaxis protein [Novosphingobium sp. MMS21-SN21R]|uniref:methyl-accepting chemotaxis protein n=1 Tax=Novosphingobium sp. MMS21-SN21R TaxID=2969298 RepID=UPI0028875B0A|nr:methyl-accepting chemotaxis protein [Novosphingobium sp. MMS21-SN21R]MDT0507115.1 methyl-accepting chemotaxis protein [Novosphingobium sp. MMS21-SN21R]